MKKRSSTKYSGPSEIRYGGATYVLASEDSSMMGGSPMEFSDFSIDDLLSYDQIREHNAIEMGHAYTPDGEWLLGWMDDRGRKFAELDLPDNIRSQLPTNRYFLRIDNKPSWRWDDGEEF